VGNSSTNTTIWGDGVTDHVIDIGEDGVSVKHLKINNSASLGAGIDYNGYTGINISYCNITGNFYGIYGCTEDVSQACIYSNCLSENNISISVCFGVNVISNNYIFDNYDFGLSIISGGFVYNNYFDNTNNVVGTTAYFNISKTLGTNIIGGPYLGGNYWNNYTGEDTNGDGLGDTDVPFMNLDYFPLTTQNNIRFIDINNGSNGTTIIPSGYLVFNWTFVSNADRYQFQIANDQDFTDLVVNISDINELIYPSHCTISDNVSFILPSGYSSRLSRICYCRVRAYIKD